MPPIGYQVRDKALIIDEDAAELVRDIYLGYLATGSVRLLKTDLDRLGKLTQARISRRHGQSGGRPFGRGHLYRILSNPVYTGKVVHRGNVYPGQHPAIIDETLWDAVQAKIISNRHGEKTRSNATEPGLLAGLLFDEEGERFTSVHSKNIVRRKQIADGDAEELDSKNSGKLHNKASKHYRRYRYYVSQRLIRESKEQAPHSLRMPALDLEQVVINRLKYFLSNGTELLKLVDSHGLEDGHAVHTLLVTAEKKSVKLDPERISYTSDASSIIELLQIIVERILVRQDTIEIGLKLGPLIAEARTASQASAEAWTTFDWSTLCHTIILPFKSRRIGHALQLIVEVPSHELKRCADAKTVKMLSNAYIWFNQLSSGKAASIKEIADQQGLTASYISRVLYLAFLAPDIVRAIIRGRQPDALTTERLIRSIPLPVSWEDQRQQLAFRQPGMGRDHLNNDQAVQP